MRTPEDAMQLSECHVFIACDHSNAVKIVPFLHVYVQALHAVLADKIPEFSKRMGRKQKKY